MQTFAEKKVCKNLPKVLFGIFEFIKLGDMAFENFVFSESIW